MKEVFPQGASNKRTENTAARHGTEQAGPQQERRERARRAETLFLTGYEPSTEDAGNGLAQYATAGELAYEAIQKGVQAARENVRTDPSFLPLFESDVYRDLDEENKAALLRACLGTIQREVLENAVERDLLSSDLMRTMISQMKALQSTSRKTSEQIPGAFFSSNDLFGAASYSPLHPGEDASTFEAGRPFYLSQIRRYDPAEYPFEPLVFDLLDEFPHVVAERARNTDLLVEFWLKSRNPAYANGVVEALSALDAPRAAQRLLEALRGEKENKRSISAILYRLELGRIGISAEGVRYFGKLYDLGSLNRPDYFVNRLTARGDIGVFDGQRTLQGYFSLGDLTENTESSEAITTQVMAITEELLFAQRAEANAPESLAHEQLVEEFKEKYFSLYAESFFQKTGVHFNNLSFREQGQLLFFMNRADTATKERTTDFVRQFGESGFRTFLALEYDRSLGEPLLAFAHAHPQEAARVFAQFGALADTAEDARQFLEQEFGIGDAEAHHAADAVTDQMLRRAKDLLARAVHTTDADFETLQQELGETNTAALTFAAAFRSLREQGALSLDDLPETASLSLVVESGAEAGEDAGLRERMAALYRKGHAHEPPAFVDKLIAQNEERLGNSASRFVLLRHHDALIGMLRFDERREASGAPKSLYAGGFNIDRDYGNGKLGEAMFEAAFANMRRLGLPIEGHGDPAAPISQRYLDWGFVADRVDLGELSGARWHLTMDPTKHWRSKELSEETLIAHADQQDVGSIRVLSMDAPPTEIPPNTVLTRLIHKDGRYYAVFESTTAS